MKELLTKDTAWALSGAALLFAGAATALLAAPGSNPSRDAALASNALNAANSVATPTSTAAVSSEDTSSFPSPSPSPSPRSTVNNTTATPRSNAGNTTRTPRPAIITSLTGKTLWTTYKGDAQRTGASDVRVSLPLGLQWRYSSEAEPGPIIGSPLIINTSTGRTVLYNAGRNIFALNAETGEMLWTSSSVSALRAPLALIPSTSGDIVLTTSSSGIVQALRATNGAKIWNYKVGAGVSVAPTLVKTTKGTRVIIASNDGSLIALTASGARDTTWNARLGTGTSPAASPSLDRNGKRLLVSGRDGYLYIIDVNTARTLQVVNLGAESPMSAIDAGSFIVTGAGSTALGIRVDNNSIVWRTTVNEENILSVSSTGNVAYFTTNRGSVIALNVKDGKQLWKSSVGRTSLSGAPLVLPNTILVGGRDSILYALDRGTGKVTWRYRVDTERSVVVPPKVLMNTGGTSTGAAFPGATPNRGFNPGVSNSIPTNPATAFTTATPVATPTPVYALQTYGISSAPAIVDGQLVIAADNGALYSFATSFFDGAPPSIADTQISVPTVEGGTYTVKLDSTLPGIPVKGPVSLDIQLKDEGSGVDPNRIRATFDGAPVAAANLKFNPSTGVLRAEVQKYQRGEANELSEGSHTLTIEAVDYSGNTMRADRTFKANKTFQSPSIPRVATIVSTPTPAPAPPSWRNTWDPQNGPPPWAGRGGRNRPTD